MFSRKFLAVAALTLVTAGTAKSQDGKPATAAAPQTTAAASSQTQVDGGTPAFIKPETAEERRARVGNVDPGLNPDPNAVFYRYGQQYHIQKYERKWAAYDSGPGAVRPFAFTPFVREIYQQNEKWVWVWEPIIDPAAVAQPAHEPTATRTAAEKTKQPYSQAQLKYLRYIAPEFSTLSVPESTKTIRFEESSAGLPTSGSWRNSLAIADMNGDGIPDIIAPPQRGAGNSLPAIFLGDGKGGWKAWTTAIWPYELDYGSVVAADFNKDGKMDLAFAIHLQGLRVFLGDGNGHFTDSSSGLPMSGFGSRRVIVADVDGDGYPDVVTEFEGGASRGEGMAAAAGPIPKIRAFLNRNKGKEWKEVAIADAKRLVSGDYLASGNFNGDKVPDFVAGSIYFQGAENLYLSQQKKTSWAPLFGDGTIVPYLSYYFAVATGHFSSKRLDDALMSFVRFWPSDIDPALIPKPAEEKVVGIDRVTFAGAEPRRVPLIRFAGDRPISGMAVGDFDGDGNLDVIFTMGEPREAVLLLGDGKGGFTRAKIEGLPLAAQPNYDLKVADVNGDGRPDVVIMYESSEVARTAATNGSIHVFLNRGSVSGAATATK